MTGMSSKLSSMTLIPAMLVLLTILFTTILTSCTQQLVVVNQTINQTFNNTNNTINNPISNNATSTNKSNINKTSINDTNQNTALQLELTTDKNTYYSSQPVIIHVNFKNLQAFKNAFNHDVAIFYLDAEPFFGVQVFENNSWIDIPLKRSASYAALEDVYSKYAKRLTSDNLVSVWHQKTFLNNNEVLVKPGTYRIVFEFVIHKFRYNHKPLASKVLNATLVNKTFGKDGDIPAIKFLFKTYSKPFKIVYAENISNLAANAYVKASGVLKQNYSITNITGYDCSYEYALKTSNKVLKLMSETIDLEQFVDQQVTVKGVYTKPLCMALCHCDAFIKVSEVSINSN